jgi:hypothetical protein
MRKDIKSRNLEGRLSGHITDQIIKNFRTYCENGEIEGVLLRSGEFSLNKMDNKKIHLHSGLTTLESRLGLPVECTFSGTPAPDCWLKNKFPNGVDEEQILYRLGKKYTNDSINAASKIT